jgi:flagellar biosynthesis/type III secretory pathway chaperone
MATLIETLVQVLEDECSVFDQLIAVSQEKTQVIVANDIERLKQITDQEQDVLTTIANLEKKREEATIDIATVLGKNPKGVTLKDVIGFLEGQAEAQNQLASVHDRLLERVQRLDRENQHNQVLVNDQLEMIEYNLNVIQGMRQAPETGAYNKGAYNAGETYAPVHGYFDSSS